MRDLSLETYIKQLEMWAEINEDIPEYVKYQDFIENLKVNKEIKGLPWYIGEHVLPTLDKKPDQTVKQVLELLDPKYSQIRTEKANEVVDDWLNFKEDQYEDDRELILAIKEISQRHKDLKMMED